MTEQAIRAQLETLEKSTQEQAEALQKSVQDETIRGFLTNQANQTLQLVSLVKSLLNSAASQQATTGRDRSTQSSTSGSKDEVLAGLVVRAKAAHEAGKPGEVSRLNRVASIIETGGIDSVPRNELRKSIRAARKADEE